MHIHGILEKSLLAASVSLLLAMAGTARADQVTGEIAVQLTLGTGCVVNGSGGASTAAGLDFGDIDFGAQPVQFQQVDTSLTGQVGTGIRVQCTAGNAPVLTFDGGQHYGAGPLTVRAMQHATDTSQVINYRLYADAGRTVEITSNGTVTLPLNDGSEQSVAVYARAFGRTGAASGAYRDTIGVTLDF